MWDGETQAWEQGPPGPLEGRWSCPWGGALCMGSEARPGLQVAVTPLCAAGPMQTVEIQVESSSLRSLCSTHHAVIGRLQVRGPAWGVGDGGCREHGTVGTGAACMGVTGPSLLLPSVPICSCSAVVAFSLTWELTMHIPRPHPRP